MVGQCLLKQLLPDNLLEHPYPMIRRKKIQIINTWVEQENGTLISKEKVDPTATEISIRFDGKRLGKITHIPDKKGVVNIGKI